MDNYLSYIYDSSLSKIIKNMINPIRVGTDCSGIDAPIQALKLLGIPYSYIFASDIDKNSKQSIMCNDTPKIFYDDILTRDHSKLPKIDFYIAGFPCQAFSTLGKRYGFNDPKLRGTIFFHCFETIRLTKPDFFILENVKGLINHDGGNTYKIIMELLSTLQGYNIYDSVYNTKDYGIPQSRERIYIIGSIKKYEVPKPIPLKNNIEDFLENNVNDPYYYELTAHKSKLLNELLDFGVINNIKDNWFVNLNVSSYKRTGAKKDIVPCLLAGEGGNCTYYLTSKSRRLTEREYLRLQGFPDTFIICVSRSKTYKQAGNSMSVNVLCFIIKNALMGFFL